MTSLDPNELPAHLRLAIASEREPSRAAALYGGGDYGASPERVDEIHAERERHVEELAAGIVAEDDNVGDLIVDALDVEELHDPVAEIARTHPDQLTEREQRIRSAILRRARAWASSHV